MKEVRNDPKNKKEVEISMKDDYEGERKQKREIEIIGNSTSII
jgi:hypothetical protein